MKATYQITDGDEYFKTGDGHIPIRAGDRYSVAAKRGSDDEDRKMSVLYIDWLHQVGPNLLIQIVRVG